MFMISHQTRPSMPDYIWVELGVSLKFYQLIWLLGICLFRNIEELSLFVPFFSFEVLQRVA